ncbi:MAG: carbohydrate ABC transporter permease [Bacillota bacterium]
MLNKLKKIDKLKLFNTLVLGAISMFFLIPLIWMVSTAFKFESDVFVFPIEWIPKRINVVHNFKEVWFGEIPFYRFYLNSIKIAGITTITTIFISSMAAFSFSKLKFKGKDILFFVLISLMIIPEQSTLVPRFLLIRVMGLYDTHGALIFMAMFSIYFTFLIRQFMLSIEDDYIESAKIDGANYFRIYWQVILPLCKPILATVGIIKFIWTWNDYQNPLIFLLSKDLYPITMGMQLFQDDFADNYAVLMMASLSAILPLVIIFVILQKQVIEGISLGGVKG